MFKRATRLGALVLAIAAAGCSGSDGAQGPQGPQGAQGPQGNTGPQGSTGPQGTNGTSGTVGKLSLTIDSVATVGGTSTVTFTVRPAANVCPGGVCDPNLASLGQKTFYAQEYNTTNNTFDTAKNFSFGGITFKALTADGNGAQYTATKAGAPFAPETSTSAFVYGYIATKGAVPAPTTGHYSLPSSVSSAAKVFGSVAGYASNANVAGCEKCHGAPYSKHGYRQARVAGLPDFASCKVCHTDQRAGSDAQWYLIADDPASLIADPNLLNTDLRNKYAYTANIMNDVHNSHAFEFAYPQSMSNCVTCHAGKLAAILTDANFKPTTCKSCHPVTAVAGIETGRAPAMKDIWTKVGVSHSFVGDLYANNAADACNTCHKAGGSGKTFAQVHAGYSTQIYADANGTRYQDARKATVTSASFDYASYVGTATFSVEGVPSTAVVVPTVVASLYGYDTKDFVVSGHNSRILECTGVDAACAGKLVTTASATPNTWTVTFDLSSWGSQLDAKQIKRMELAVLPSIGIDPTAVISTTTGNLAAGVTGATQTIDVSQTKADARISGVVVVNQTTGATKPVWYKGIVDPTKCNACHDELGITFHGPNYGSAGTVACRMCHSVLNAASHIEMQGRSIDSYVHSIHAMQVLDAKNVNLNDPVAALRYGDHVEANYPNFAGPLNCESCHNPGTYDVPDQAKSLPGLMSASATVAGRTGLGAFPGEITGPGARACGGCHRAFAINEADGAKLAAFVAHTNDFSSNIDPLLSVTSTAAYLEGMVGAAPAAPAVAGAQVEQCTICHSTAGSDHQALFNVWKSGL